MRTAFRSLAALLLAVAVVTCVDSPVAPKSGPGGSGARASLAIAPHFSPAAAQAAVVFDANGFLVDQVQVVVTEPGATPPLVDTLADTTIAYDPSNPPASLSLQIAVDPGAQVSFSLNYLSDGTVLYNATGTTTTIPVGTAPPADQTSPVVVPVGPGITASQVAVSPVSGSFSTASSIQFAATVTDAGGNLLAGALVSWTVSDPTLASIGAGSGLLQPTGKRGSVTVTATTLDGVTGQSTISLVPPPAKLVLVSGGGQTGLAGAALSQPVIVQLQATDQAGVAGQIVTFSVSGGTGGSASPTTAATDVNGDAQTTITLGTTPGQYTVTATAAGFSTPATETANATTVSSLVIVSGNLQSDSVKQQLPASLVVKATDQFGNPKSGVTVTWARTAGSGTPSATTTTTASDGTASISYTFGSTIGTETVTATATGVTQPVTFTETATAGGPAAAKFTVSPTSSASGAAITPAVQVTVTDVGGNPVTAATSVTMSLTGGSPAATLSGTLTQKTVAGVATFANLSVDKVASGYTLVATVAGGVKTTSAAFAVSLGAAAQMQLLGPPAVTITAGSTNVPTAGIEVTDAGGNPVTGVPVLVTLDSGSVVKGDSTLLTDAAGFVTLAEVAAAIKAQMGGGGGSSTGTYTIVFSNTSLQGTPISLGLTIVPGPASQLQFVTIPPPGQGTAGAVLPTIAVAVEDASGNVVTTATGSVTLSLNTVPTGGPSPSIPAALAGTITQPLVNGVATFTNLVLNKSGAYTLKATSTGTLAGVVISSSFGIIPGPATTLVIGTVPSTVAAGASIGSPNGVTVTALDAEGNQANVADTITMSITGGTAGAVLSGSNSPPHLVMNHGAVTFSILSINLGGTGYQLVASSTGLPSATSTSFTVTGAVATRVRFTVQPSSTTAGAVSNPAIQATLYDVNGNIATSATNTITLSIKAGTGAAGAVVFNGSVNPTNGVSVFSSLTINVAGTSYQLVANGAGGGITPDTSFSFNVSAGAEHQVVFSTFPPASDYVGVPFSPAPVVHLVDAFNNLVPSSDTVSLAFNNNLVGATLYGAKVAAVNGIATFSNLTINRAGSFGIAATAPNAAIAAVDSFSVTYSGFLTVTPFTASNGTPGAALAGSSVTYSLQLKDSLPPATSSSGVVGATFNWTLRGQTGVTFSPSAVSTTDTTGHTSVTVNYPAGVAASDTLTATLSTGQATVSQLGIVVSTPPTQLAFNGASYPSSGTNGVTLGTANVIVENANGNGLVDPGVVVTASLTAGPGGTLSGTTSVTTNSSGQAIFSNLKITGAVGAYTLSFAATGLTPVSTSVVLAVGPPQKVIFDPAPPGDTLNFLATSLPTGTLYEVVDSSGNPISGYQIAFTVVPTSPSGSTIIDTLTSASGGTFSMASIGAFSPPPGKYNIQLSDPSGKILAGNGDFPNPLNVTITGPAYEIVSTGSPGSVSYGAAFALTYELIDNSGARVVSAGAPTTVTLTYTCPSCYPPGGAITGTLSVNTVNGVATFSNLSSSLPGGGGGTYTFTASATGLISLGQVQVQVYPSEQSRVPDRGAKIGDGPPARKDPGPQ